MPRQLARGHALTHPKRQGTKKEANLFAKEAGSSQSRDLGPLERRALLPERGVNCIRKEGVSHQKEAPIASERMAKWVEKGQASPSAAGDE
jgi:hypothetical protein